MAKIIDWFDNIVWVDKVFHLVAGIIGYFTLIHYSGSIYKSHGIILLGNCLWEYIWSKTGKKEKWCWLDWISVELGAVSTQLVYMKNWAWSPIGGVIWIAYFVLLLWYWGIWPFEKRWE